MSLRPVLPSTKSRNEVAKEAFSEVVAALEKDLPLVMHGSGDVQPSSVLPESVRLLAELTADYISNLVHEAVASHEILNDGPKPLPPPPLPKSRKTVTPRPYDEEEAGPTKGKDSKNANKIAEPRHRKRRRTTDEFWDEPLPEPKIKNKPTKVKETTGPKFQGVPVDEWVGVSGVDFFETNRARNAHVTAPAAIGAHSFIFPVCHDVGLYGRVLEVQAARRTIAPLLVDPVIQDVVRNEANLHGIGTLRKRDKKRKSGAGGEADDEEPEETDSEDEDGGGATWPGLESLLPIHTTEDFRRFL